MRIRNIIEGIYRRFCRREKVAIWSKRFLVFCKALIIVSKSSSRIIDEKPWSNAKEIALTATKASLSSTKGGSVTFSDRNARTTPKPASKVSLNIAPSKLIFKDETGGGHHLTQEFYAVEGRAELQGETL